MPHPLDPVRPLVLRVAVNYSSVEDSEKLIKKAGWETRLREQRQEAQIERWKMELSVLPHQLVSFAP